LKFDQTKSFPNSHLGDDFHIYELVWGPKEITLSIDGINYGSLNSNFRESAVQAKIKSAVNWDKNAPFDKEVKTIYLKKINFKKFIILLNYCYSTIFRLVCLQEV
jgi:Glycosyl hydrolases family 16